MVKSSSVYSPQNFLLALTGHCYCIHGDVATTIRHVLQKHRLPVADYPLENIQAICDRNIAVILVDVSDFDETGTWVRCYRWFQVPDSFVEMDHAA